MPVVDCCNVPSAAVASFEDRSSKAMGIPKTVHPSHRIRTAIAAPFIHDAYKVLRTIPKLHTISRYMSTATNILREVRINETPRLMMERCFIYIGNIPEVF